MSCRREIYMFRAANIIWTSTLLGAAILTLTACSNAPNQTSETNSNFQFGQGGGPGVDKSGDAQLQAMIANVAPQFQQFVYEDKETGLKVPYNLYIPRGHDATDALPMVMFIADASTVGKDVKAPLEQGWGGLIWATPEAQAKHPAFVLVPEYPEVAIDDHGSFTTTPYVELTRRLVLAVAQKHGADKKRIFATGQSMGCMISLLLSAKYPDLFAAEMFVSGQWDLAQLDGLTGQRFAYIVSAGDAKASAGQAEVRSALTKKGVSFSSTQIDGKWAQEKQNAAASAMLAKGNKANFITFESGSVLPEGMASGGAAGDHMYSFDPAYRLEPVRDWLFTGK